MNYFCGHYQQAEYRVWNLKLAPALRSEGCSQTSYMLKACKLIFPKQALKIADLIARVSIDDVAKCGSVRPRVMEDLLVASNMLGQPSKKSPVS